MYEAFYGLHERPFELNPNPRFLFMTPGHREALSTIQYGIEGRKGLTLVVGAPGTGKTTLVHAALERQNGEHAHALYLTNPVISREEFFEFLAEELGITKAAAKSKTTFLKEVRRRLLERHAEGMLTALIIDEAQAMPDELLEEVRLLENLETSSQKLLPVVLVGQSELGERLQQPALLPLKQRIALRSTLAPLTAQETATYVSERIRIAGGDIRSIFKAEAVAAICESCGGIPRTISVVCDNALVSGFALDQHPIGAIVIAEVCRDFDLPLPKIAGSIDGFVATAVALAGHAPQGQHVVAVVPPPTLYGADATLSNVQMSDSPPVETLLVEAHGEDPSAPPRPTLPERMRALRSLISRGAHR